MKKRLLALAISTLLLFTGALAMAISWPWYEDFDQLASVATDVVRVEALDAREELVGAPAARD